jgi:pimeloyl-ACP methyl ester carboxylesterase
MPHLEVEGAELYYEAVGEGPPLVCIHGAGLSVEAWQPLAEQLKNDFKVIMYDRTFGQKKAL